MNYFFQKLEAFLEYQTARIEDYVEDLVESKHHSKQDLALLVSIDYLTYLSKANLLSYRNQSVDLYCKPVDCFLQDV